MPLDLIYRPSALSDLDAIYNYIELENPRRAISFVEEISERCRILRDYPKLGPTRDSIAFGI